LQTSGGLGQTTVYSRALHGPGSIILKNHRAGLGRVVTGTGRAGLVSIRPVKSAGSLTCNISVVHILPLRGRTSLLASHVGVDCLQHHPQTSPSLPLSVEHADCRNVFWFVSAVGLETGSGRAGLFSHWAGLSWACIFLQCNGPGQAKPFLGRA